MHLPSTFFLRLDSHQAAVAVGVFELFFHIPCLVVLALVHSVISPANELFYNELEKEIGERALSEFENFVTGTKLSEMFYVVTIGLMIYAVHYRRRWLMIPWFVLTFANVVGLVLLYISIFEIIYQNLSALVVAIILWTIFFLLVVAIEIYSALAVYCSFREIGMANRDTPNRESAITVQFHPISANRGGLV